MTSKFVAMATLREVFSFTTKQTIYLFKKFCRWGVRSIKAFVPNPNVIRKLNPVLMTHLAKNTLKIILLMFPGIIDGYVIFSKDQ